MAGEIKGLQVDVSMDTSKFEKGYSQIKRSMSTFNSALKNTRNEIKYGEKSQKSYKNHMDTLKTSIAKSETNVKQLSKAYEGLSEEQKRGVKGHQFISQMAKEEDQMRRLKNELQSTQLTYGETYTAMGKIGQSFKSVGAGMQNVGSQMQNVGRNLSNSITKPALIAGTAMAGITAKLGFDRLVGLDTAKAKLEGLGYSTKDVGRITDQVTSAIKGGMTTMAEGTDVAAGALAAGVKEGKELEKYIKLVGDAAVGSNRPVADMAQIFNRVQGQGKLMTQELNMVEEGMPGFSNAMAKHMGVSYEAFREMVTEGKVTSKDFLTVMDDFAGGMAGAYSKSFKGMVQNTKAYVGIIGESLLSGVFEKSKASLHEFEKLLQSDAVQNWAAQTGEKLGAGVEKISGAIQSLIGWWKELDKGTQKTLGGIVKWLAITLVTVGPLLTIFGKLVTVTGGMFTTFGALAGSLGKISFMAKEAGSLMGGLQAVFPKLATSISVMTGPVGWITAGVVALGIAFFVAYKKSETFRNIVNKAVTGVMNTFKAAMGIVKGFFQLFKGNGQDGVITLSKILPPDVVVGLTNFADTVKRVFFQVINAVKTFAMQIGQMLSKFWKENGAEITQAVKNIGSVISTVFRFIWGSIIKPIMNLIWNIMKLLWPAIKLLIVDTWNNIKNIIKGALDVIMGVIKIFSSLFTGNWKGMWQGVKQATGGALKLIWAAIQLWFIGKIFKVIKLSMSLIRGVIFKGWKFIHTFIATTVYAIWNKVKTAFNGLYKSTRNIFTNLSKWSSNLWNSLKNNITKFAQGIWNNVRTKFSNLYKSTRNIFTNLSNWSRNLWSKLKNEITKLAQNIWTNVRNKFTGMFKSVRNIFNNISNFSRKIWTSIKNKITSLAQSIWTNVKNKFTGMFNSVKKILTNLFNTARNIFTNIKNRVTSIANVARDNVVNGFKAMYDKGKSWIDKLKNFLGDSISGFKKVASDLGKGVANGAIKGLNGMIDGINALSNKVMNKKLIKKKIPKLSTGTGVQVDNNGLLKRSTKAVVNDKGPGNGKGPNGHKELIYRRGGKIEQPVGNNKKVSLRRGDGVINGAQSQSLIPHLSTGTVMDRLFGSGAKSSNKKPKDKKKWYEKTGDNIGKAWDSTKDAGKKVAETTSKGVKSVMKGIGDVWDYASNPKKLIDKVMGGLGINFDGVGGVMGNFIKWGAKKLKEGMVDLVTGWFEDESGGGDGSSFTKFGVTTPYSPNKAVPGYPTAFNGGRHYGIDYGTPSGTTIKAPTSGTVSKLHNQGGGLVARLLSGKFTQFFMHLSDIMKTGRVKQGDNFAKTGNSGQWTTGPHLHYQVEKGKSADITNKNTMDPAKFLAGKGGGSKSSSKWRNDIVRAASSMKAKISGGDIRDIIRLIETESGGRAGVTQGIKDINSGGNEARGLLQYTPGTFAGYAAKGSKNILNGYHQLKAFFNNSNWRRDLNAWKARMARGATGWGPTGSKRGYATGGLINANGLYNLAEDGHPEFVIPTDPKRQSDAMKLLAIASQRIEGNKKNKRPNQMRTPSPTASNNNAETLSMLAKMVEQQQEQINILTKIALSNQDIADKPVMSERDVSKAQGRRSQMMSYNLGGAF